MPRCSRAGLSLAPKLLDARPELSGDVAKAQDADAGVLELGDGLLPFRSQPSDARSLFD